MTKNVVHTGAAPGETIPEVSKELDVPGVNLIQRGPCKTPEALLAALDEGEAKGAAGQTLADLLSEVPRSRSPGAAVPPPAEARADPSGAPG